jgi:hypothetical protein
MCGGWDYPQVIKLPRWTFRIWGSAKSFWDTDQLTQDEVLHRMSEIGAKAVVSSDAPTGPGASRWLRIGNTAYYLLWLDRPAVAAQEHRSK